MDRAKQIGFLFPTVDSIPPDVCLETPLRKDSAEGTLSVSGALRVFSIRTLVAAKAGELNKHILNTIVREGKSNFLSTDFIL